MYLNFYHLKESPFNLTPDSHFLFLGAKHKEALVHIRYGLSEKKGFIMVTGAIGAGKTTLCRSLLREMEQRYNIALVLNSMLSPTSLLKVLIKDLGITTKARSRYDMTDVLYQYILDQKNVVVVIDEAQNLGVSTLEQVRLLGNLETEKEKLLQIILVGQPELKDRLASERLRQLNQRIAVRYHLEPLNREETTGYINYRLAVAGNEGKIRFPEEAVQSIYNYSGGVPRVINIVCDYSLVYGYIRETHIITRDIVERAIKESQGIICRESVLV